MRFHLLFFLLLIIFSCDKKESFKSANWIILNDKNKIPVPIQDFFEAYEGRKLKISNPDENFNITDAIQYPDAPFRQLRLLEKKNETWRMVYIQGGVGKSYQFYEFKIVDDTIANIKKGYSFKNIETNDSLEYYIKNRKVNLEKINIKYKWVD